MGKYIIDASLVSLNKIELSYFTHSVSLETLHFFLKDNDGKMIHLNGSYYLDKNLAKYTLISDIELELGKDYLICSTSGDNEYLDYEIFTNSKEFEEKYTYDGDDLGANYTKNETTFKVYSPLSSKLILTIENDDGEFDYLPMNKEEKGIFSLTLKGDYSEKLYRFGSFYNGKRIAFVDPYGKGMGINSIYSKVVDLSKLKSLQNVEPINSNLGLSNSIIYELNVRDFTQNLTDRASFLSLMHKIPYLQELGVNYVQLLPVFDYYNVDDITRSTYNWGYDPLSYFALEGSLSNNPNKGIERILEFKKLVNELHKANIRVILDVVFNHVYEYRTSIYEKSFPNYYFRKLNNKICNGSGCGNDFASEKKMARKLILDSIKYSISTFDIDGFRFDLLGLVDIKTTKEIIKIAKSMKPNILLYGEGWDMNTNLSSDNKSSSVNAKKLEGMGFFNADFRDIIKGDTFDKNSKGYALGNLEKRYEAENVLLGSYLNNDLIDASQSINFVECHDNQTLFDKLNDIYKDENLTLKHVKFINTLTLLSFGRPFIHMGQEIGQSKNGNDNTYNVMDINSMRWDLVSSRKDMIEYIKQVISLRKSHDIFDLSNKEEIANSFTIVQRDNGILEAHIINPIYLYGHKDIMILINPTDEDVDFRLENGFKLYFDDNGFVSNKLVQDEYVTKSASLSILIGE